MLFSFFGILNTWHIELGEGIYITLRIKTPLVSPEVRLIFIENAPDVFILIEDWGLVDQVCQDGH
jgi:hypothetical protein